MESRESLDIDIVRYLLMFKRQWLTAILVFSTTVALSLVATTFLKNTYQASGSLLFRRPTFIVNGSSNSSLESVSKGNPINNKIQLIESSAFLQEISDQLQLKDLEGEPLEGKDVGGDLTLKIVPGTDVLRISYMDRDPKIAAEVVNTIMDLYIRNEIEFNNSEAVATRKFLSSQLPVSLNKVNISSSALRQFKQENQITNLAEEMKFVIGNIGDIDTQINTNKAQIRNLDAQRQEIKNQLALNNQKVIDISSLNQSESIQKILDNIQQVDIELANEKSRFYDDNPVVISLEEKKAGLQKILQQEIDNKLGQGVSVNRRLLQAGELEQSLLENLVQIQVQIAGLERQQESLISSREFYEKRLRIIPALEQRLKKLEQNLEVAQSSYSSILNQVQQLELADKKNTTNARIVSKALVPEKPSASKKLLLVVLGAIFGTSFAAIMVLLIELRNKNIRSLQEIKQRFNYTILGALPLIEKQDISNNPELIYPDVTVLNAPQSPISEIYRLIQANLKFFSSEQTIKTLVVTSTVAQEGKSLVSANLAAAISQLGKRVLVIDADMRSPSQQNIWKVPNDRGLSSVLLGKEDFYNSGWHITNDLDILTSGDQTSNPLALLDSHKMALLISELQSQYDMIIIDAPSFMVAADAFTLAQMSDGILLVARPGVMDYDSAIAGQEILKQSGQNILGIVVNGLIENNEPNNQVTKSYQYYLTNKNVSSKQKKSNSGIYSLVKKNEV